MWRYYREPSPYVGYDEAPQFREIKKCFVRRDHLCGKFLGASKSCFVACPSTNDVKIMADLIEEKLMKIGIEPIVATKIRAYGQDIFCIKICGKIIESQFCIVILDDEIQIIGNKNISIPNPNVYFEYGLMTALGKYIIPLQKDGQKLAFNIQTHDTIKYTPENISTELDKALKDATRITSEERETYQGEMVPKHLCHSFLGISGYRKMGYSWFLSEELADTVFTGYKNDRRSEYIFFTVIDNKDMLKSCIIDIQVITKRMEGRLENLIKQIESNNIEIKKYQKEPEAKEEAQVELEKKTKVIRNVRDSYYLERRLSELLKDNEDASDKAELIQNSKFAVILTPELTELREKCINELGNISYGALKLPAYFGDISGIKIADVEIQFKAPEL